jgi:hypothetical protein
MPEFSNCKRAVARIAGHLPGPRCSRLDRLELAASLVTF